MDNFADRRDHMVEHQLRSRGIGDTAILDAFRSVPRECFVDASLAERAYDDGPLPIAAGQTISQPYIVALMIAEAGVRRGHRVLEVGAGSGYAAAILGRIAKRVIAIERQPELVHAARERLASLGCTNVRIIEGDGTAGWLPDAPYDAILVAASGHTPPEALVKQLKVDGRLVMPVGSIAGIQQLIRLTKRDDGSVERADLCPVRFVPLIGPGYDPE